MLYKDFLICWKPKMSLWGFDGMWYTYVCMQICNRRTVQDDHDMFHLYLYTSHKVNFYVMPVNSLIVRH